MNGKTIIRISSVLLMSIMSTLSYAQAEEVKNEGHPLMDWALHNIVFIMAGCVIIGALWLLWNVMNLFMANYTSTISKEKGIAYEPKTAQKSESIWAVISRKAVSLVPRDQEAQLDLGHDYDGIKELDNKLPPWWLYLFYGTIIWAGAYVYVSHFSDFGSSQQEEYEQQMKVAAAIKLEHLSKLANAVDETNVTLVSDQDGLEEGKSIYFSQCAACHGQLGEGGIGPNFSDRYWVHGGDIKDLFKTIKYGVPEKGMISWKAQLSPSAMQNTASYILSLEGTDPPNQKAAEGKLYEREGDQSSEGKDESD